MPVVCRRALGWLHADQGIPLGDLRLKSLLPSSDRSGVSLAFDYSQFLLHERHVSPYTQGAQILSSDLCDFHILRPLPHQAALHTGNADPHISTGLGCTRSVVPACRVACSEGRFATYDLRNTAS